MNVNNIIDDDIILDYELEIMSKTEKTFDKEKFKKKLYKMKSEIKEEEKKINDIISNTNYFDWLNQFTQDKTIFYKSDYHDYFVSNKTEDMKNIMNLFRFYNGIDMYAKSNYIYPSVEENENFYGKFYKIRMNDIGYKIGYVLQKPWLYPETKDFFAEKIEIDKLDNFIDYNDIMNGKKQDNVDYINNNLDNLSNTITELYSYGIPIEAIVNQFYYTIHKLKVYDSLMKEGKMLDIKDIYKCPKIKK